MSKKIRTGDLVQVLTGRDKGKQGVVLSFSAEDRIVVEGVNVVKKHMKPNPSRGVVGGVVDKLLPVHISNVAIFNASTGKADRVKFILVEGKKQRVFVSTGESLPVKS
jgi:large subunit ribosomal protein L24